MVISFARTLSNSQVAVLPHMKTNSSLIIHPPDMKHGKSGKDHLNTS